MYRAAARQIQLTVMYVQGATHTKTQRKTKLSSQSASQENHTTSFGLLALHDPFIPPNPVPRVHAHALLSPLSYILH